jgi:hypothetical protein
MTKSLIAAVVLVIIIAGIGTAQTPKQNQILFDFRTDKRGSEAKIPAATQRTVLSKVFRTFLTDQSKCNSQFEPANTDNYLKALRDAGQIAPTIVDVATGSFTATAQTQTAYLISVNECGASHADNYGSKRMAIFSGDKLVADVDLNFKNSILRKTDLNADGVDELLLMSAGMNQGIIVEMSVLVDFKNGQMNVLEDFGQTSEDSCGSAMPGSESIAAVVSFSAGASAGMPKFRIDHYKSACRRVKTWRFKSTGKL